LLLTGCSAWRAPSPDREFRAVRAELRQGRLPSAQQHVEEILRRSLGPRDRLRFQLLQAEVLLARGRVTDGLAIVSAPIPPADWKPPLEMRRQVLLATALSRNGHPARVTAALDSAEAAARALGDGETLREIENVRARVFIAGARPAAAEACLRRAIASARQAHDDYWLACSLLNLAYFKVKVESRYDEGVRFGELAIQAARRAGALRFLAAASGNTSLALAELGQFPQALARRREALEMQRRVDDRPQVAQSLGEIGRLLASEERPAEALAAYREAFDYSDRIGATADAALIAGNIASANIALGRWDDAERWNARAAELKRRASVPVGYMNLNAAEIAAGRGNWAEAQRLYRGLLADPSSDPTLRFASEAGLGVAGAKTGARAEARRRFENALALIETNRDALAGDENRITFLARMIRAWRAYVDFLAAEGRGEAALEVVERGRAHVLAGRLRAQRTAIPSALPLARLRAVAARQRCTFLSYWLAPDRSFVWILDAAGLRMRSLPPAIDIDALVAAWQRRIQDEPGDPLEARRQAGDRLFTLLLEGVRPEAASRLVVIPDGSLHQINFATLPVPGAARYLLDDATVLLTPSLAVAASADGAAPDAPAGSLLVGVSRPGDPSFPELPMAEEEVRSIAALRPGATVLLGGAATPASVRRLDWRRFGLIHFAAHAEANPQSPLDSAIVLASQDEESKLYAREVAALPLHARLVTLSACRTAGARAYSGEGLLGLTWAFLSSGAGSVIAGLWPVGDRPAASLMQKTYAGVARGLTPSAALREAQLALRHSPTALRQPFYWGPFQLYARSAAF
jgi:tetratricopeptide (TPR) repeat protein